MQDEKATKREIWIHRCISAALIILVACGGVGLFLSKREAVEESLREKIGSLSLPFYEKVMASTNLLEYSGLPALTRPDVTLSVNFDEKTWTLHNLHRFDPDGKILLDQDRYGLCGELAAYVYTKVQPFLGERYSIQFIRAAESGFFLRPQSSHIVLVLTDKATGERYFLDPSFRRYGKEADFKGYLFFDVGDVATHFNSLKPDVAFAVDSGTPLLIRENFLLYFTVESVEGKFDKDNFIMAITANKRYDYSGRYVFALQVKGGKPKRFKNEGLLSRFLTPRESQELLTRLSGWFEQYEKDLGPA